MYDVESDEPPIVSFDRIQSSSQVRCSCSNTQPTTPSFASNSFHA